MANHVHVVITGKLRGKTHVVPFSHGAGLQFYVVNGIVTEQPVEYEVPIYEVRVAGGGVYTAVRFGLQNNGTMPPLRTRMCDAGLSRSHSCVPSWVAGYSPHSFEGGPRAGAWRLLPGKGFLIHEGADTTKGQVGGSLGCIEILDGRWNSFLEEIERLAHAACPVIGRTGTLTVTIDSASYPRATLVA
jgi:hypothetical protein